MSELRKISGKTLDDVSEAAMEQWTSNGTDDYKHKIQCCYNCPNWCVDHSLMNEYAYNACKSERIAPSDGGVTNTKFDFWCPSYGGCMTTPNLVFKELWEAEE